MRETPEVRERYPDVPLESIKAELEVSFGKPWKECCEVWRNMDLQRCDVMMPPGFFPIDLFFRCILIQKFAVCPFEPRISRAPGVVNSTLQNLAKLWDTITDPLQIPFETLRQQNFICMCSECKRRKEPFKGLPCGYNIHRVAYFILRMEWIANKVTAAHTAQFVEDTYVVLQQLGIMWSDWHNSRTRVDVSSSTQVVDTPHCAEPATPTDQTVRPLDARDLSVRLQNARIEAKQKGVAARRDNADPAEEEESRPEPQGESPRKKQKLSESEEDLL